MPRGLLSAEDVFPVRESDLPIQGGEVDVVYYLRAMSVQEMSDIRKRHTRWRRQLEETDWLKVQQEIVDRILVRWEGVTEHGEPAPCDRAHKDMLPGPIQNALMERAQMGAEEDSTSAADSFRESA